MARGIDTKPYLEWLDGVESTAVSPNTPHGVVAAELLLILRREGGTTGSAIPELHLRLNDEPENQTVLLPDVAYYRDEQLLALDISDRLLPNVPPDVIVEVRSSNDRPGFREEKLRRYLAWGCPVVLDVDPRLRTIVVHDASSAQTLTQDDRFAHPLVPWLHFHVREVFAPLDRLGL